MLDALAYKDPNIRVRKFDINRPGVEGIDFRSPLARQYVKKGIPYFQIYDPTGKQVSDNTQMVVDMCIRAGMTEDYLRQAGIIR